MKKIALIVLGIIVYTIGYAQSDKEEIQIMQNLFGMEKKALVADFIQLDKAQYDAFWALYDQYETERKAMGINRLDLIEQFAENYDNMTDDQAAQLVSQMISQRKKTDKLMDTYYKKIAKATSPIVGMQFMQLEGFVLSAIRTYVLGEVPFVKK